MKVLFFVLILTTNFLSAQDKKGKDVSVSKKIVSQQNHQQKNKEMSFTSLYGSTASAKINISTTTQLEKEIKKDDEEYYEVMTDTMEMQNYLFYPLQDDQQDKKSMQPIPLSYGKIKGVMTETGRNYLIFENEDGEIYILNVYADKNGFFSWKLYGKFERN